MGLITDYPTGQVPVLQVGDEMISQSIAIARYLAKQHGLAGKDDWEQARADMFVDGIGDMNGPMEPVFFEQDPVKKQEMFKEAVENKILPFVQIMERQLKKNGSGTLVGQSITWADLAYYHFLENPIFDGVDLKKNCPHSRRLVTTIENDPSIKKWILTRPKTQF